MTLWEVEGRHCSVRAARSCGPGGGPAPSRRDSLTIASSASPQGSLASGASRTGEPGQQVARWPFQGLREVWCQRYPQAPSMVPLPAPQDQMGATILWKEALCLEGPQGSGGKELRAENTAPDGGMMSPSRGWGCDIYSLGYSEAFSRVAIQHTDRVGEGAWLCLP